MLKCISQNSIAISDNNFSEDRNADSKREYQQIAKNIRNNEVTKALSLKARWFSVLSFDLISNIIIFLETTRYFHITLFPRK